MLKKSYLLNTALLLLDGILPFLLPTMTACLFILAIFGVSVFPMVLLMPAFFCLFFIGLHFRKKHIVGLTPAIWEGPMLIIEKSGSEFSLGSIFAKRTDCTYHQIELLPLGRQTLSLKIRLWKNGLHRAAVFPVQIDLVVEDDWNPKELYAALVEDKFILFSSLTHFLESLIRSFLTEIPGMETALEKFYDRDTSGEKLLRKIEGGASCMPKKILSNVGVLKITFDTPKPLSVTLTPQT